MNSFGKIIWRKTECRLLIYACLILFLTSFMMQYPFHSSEFNNLNDAESYKIASYWLYSSDHFASYTRPFLFPLLIGSPRLLGFEYSDFFVNVINFVFWLWTILLLFRVIRDISDEKKALPLALVFASCVSLHCFLFSIHAEVLYSFVLLSHVFCLYQYIKKGKDSWFYGAN